MLNILFSSTPKALSSQVFAKISKELSCGKQVILVVPAQSTISAEKEAFSALKKQGFFDLSIVRGRKLAELILSETSKPSKVSIDSIGKAMLLRSIAGKNEEKLESFQKIAKDKEFLDLTGSFLSELRKNGLASKDLDQIIQNTSSTILKNKLCDMKIFATSYEQLMEGKFTDSDDLVLFTANQAKNSPKVKNSIIYYYGFYSFTQRELELLAALEKESQGLNVALLCGKEEHFAVTRSTLKKLTEKMPGAIVTSEEINAPLLSINENKLRLIRCASPYNQALTIAADIKRKIREDGLSYSDIAVLTGDSTQMSESLKRVFKENSIPFFADETRTVLHSEAISAVKSLLLLASEGYKTDIALKYIKSGVLNFNINDIECFENYVKLYHIKDDKFNKSFKYGREKLGEETFAKLEEMRKIFFASTNDFVTSFSNAVSVREKALCLYNFLANNLNFPSWLDALSCMQEEAGLLDASEESKQIWTLLIKLLDQMVELIGDEEISAEDFEQLFSSSLSDIKVGVLPQAEGKLSLGSVKRSQIGNVKALYLVGLNDNILPSKNDKTGILSPIELEHIEKMGFTLAKNLDCLYEEEMFCIYKDLSLASEYICLTYCTGASDGTDLKPSELVSMVQKLYPNIQTEEDIFNNGNDLDFLEGKILAKQKLASQLRSAMEGEELKPIWMQSYNLLKDEAADIKAGLNYTNKQKALGSEIATKLFASEKGFSFSPSRLDNFASCPFKHFVSYGLRPKEEKEFGMNASEIGTVHHEALLALCSRLSLASKEGGFSITDPRSTWMSITDEQLKAMLDEILNSMENEILDGVMTSSSENKYTSKRTRSTCFNFAKHMIEEVRKTNIEEMYFETRFARGGFFPAITIDTSAGKVYIEGRIDRVDVSPKEDSKYVRVIDYKSGNTKFNKELINKGLSLQLMVYLESAIDKYPKDSSGGIYYFHIIDTPASASLEDFPKEEIADEVLKKIEKEYKLDGMDVDSEFKANFAENLGKLCARLTSGNIDIEPKKYKTLFNSCTYCNYSVVCNKDISGIK